MTACRTAVGTGSTSGIGCSLTEDQVMRHVLPPRRLMPMAAVAAS